MQIAGITLLIMGAVCGIITLFLRHIFSGEETCDVIVDGKILEYRTEQIPTNEKPIVMFKWGDREIQAYADSIPVKNRPKIGSCVKLAVRREPIPGDEDRWHAAVIREDDGMPFIQKVFYVITVASVVLTGTGLVFLVLA